MGSHPLSRAGEGRFGSVLFTYQYCITTSARLINFSPKILLVLFSNYFKFRPLKLSFSPDYVILDLKVQLFFFSIKYISFYDKNKNIFSKIKS